MPSKSWRLAIAPMIRVFCLGLIAVTTPAQSNLSGVIDIHAHVDPDSMPRSIDAIDLARLAKQRGMRGLVLKNHYESTAALAYVVRKEVPGIEIFGGIDLNLTVGGVNPAAVERMVLMRGGWGKSSGCPRSTMKIRSNTTSKTAPLFPFPGTATCFRKCCRSSTSSPRIS